MSTVKTKHTFTEGSISIALYNMALPMAGGILATMTFNVVDTLFVAGLGEEALAALSFTFPVVMLIISLSIGLGAGTSSVVAIAAGKKDHEHVKALITDSLSLTALLTISVAFLGYLSMDMVFAWLGASDSVLPLIRDYMTWWYLGILFMTVPMVCLAAFRALGNSKLQGILMIGMAIANAVLDPLLIYGWWIFPRLEIEGAAIASLIVRVFAVVILYHQFHIKERLLVNPFNWQRCVQSWKEILHVGLPAMATNMIIPVSSSLIVAMVAAHGVEAVAGFGAAVRIESMALILFYALSAVMGPFCGQNLGAGNWQRLSEGQKLTGRFCLLAGFGIALILVLARAPLASMFSNEAAVQTTITTYLLLVPLSYFAYGVVMAVNASFNGLRKPFPGMLISMSRVIFLLWPLAFLGNWILGLKGIFMAIAFSNILVGGLAYWWIHHAISKETATQDVTTQAKTV